MTIMILLRPISDQPTKEITIINQTKGNDTNKNDEKMTATHSNEIDVIYNNIETEDFASDTDDGDHIHIVPDAMHQIQHLVLPNNTQKSISI